MPLPSVARHSRCRIPFFEKCTIYDGGARRYEIHEHIEEVLEFWNGILERADSIDKQALLEEKLGHLLPISYEDWLKDCHYEKLDKKTTRWLYQQERGFVEEPARCFAEGDRAPADRRVHHDPEKVYPLKNL